MKIILLILLGILALNLVLILGIAAVLISDSYKLRRKESKHDASAETS